MLPATLMMMLLTLGFPLRKNSTRTRDAIKAHAVDRFLRGVRRVPKKVAEPIPEEDDVYSDPQPSEQQVRYNEENNFDGTHFRLHSDLLGHKPAALRKSANRELVLAQGMLLI